MRKSYNPNLRYIQHPLNPSKSKSSYSFGRSERFIQEKSFSPNKFYQLPSTISHRASTMGFGNRTNFEKNDSVEPGRYNVPSEFEQNSKTPRFTTFGINREEFYRGRTDVNPVGPGTYSISKKKHNGSIYIGARLEPPTQRHTVSAASYDIPETTINKLSTYRNNESVIRMKTQYYPKSKLHEYDNHTPGPGSYGLQQSNNRIITKSKVSLFGKQERIKKPKPSNIGPGSYQAFSQFGFS